MRFPNAYRGIKKIWIAELLMLLATILSIVIIVIPAVNGVNLSVEQNLSQAYYAPTIASLALTVAFVGLVAFFLILLGVIVARVDDENFRIALYVTILGIAASIVSAIWTNNQRLTDWMDIAITICSLFASFYILTGIASLAGKFGDEETRKVVLKARLWLEGSFCLTAILKFITVVFRIENETLLLVLGIGALVVEIISYILYLMALKRGKNMLAK